MNDNYLIVVAGATASGKTALSIRIAQHFGTEIINADSRQIFKEMHVGTAKPTDEERKAAPHHFVDIRSITQPYNAGMFEKDALQVLEKLFEAHRVVVMAGGSGLYIRAVCQGIDEMPPIKKGIREQLNREHTEKGLPPLLAELEKNDPDYFQQVDKKNPQRLIRALEIIRSSGKPYSSFRRSVPKPRPFRPIYIGLEWKRAELYKRIDTRMDQMLENGLVEEARKLYPLKHLPALQTVGYSEVFDFFDNLYHEAEMVERLKRNSRRYAKRQLTWFRKEPDIRWFHPADFEEIISYIHQQMGK